MKLNSRPRFARLILNMFKLPKDLLSLIVAVVEVLLAARLLLKLLGASAQAPVVSWVYTVSEPLLKPFQFAFPTASVKGGFTFEFTTLFALFGYAFIGYLIEEVLEMIDGYQQKNDRQKS